MLETNKQTPSGWGLTDEEDRRFRDILMVTCAAFLVLSVAMPMIPMPKLTLQQEKQVPPQVAQLLVKQHPVAKPAAPSQPVHKSAPKPAHHAHARHKAEHKAPAHHATSHHHAQPGAETVQKARRKAEHSGLLAEQDTLSSLRNNQAGNLNAKQHLSHGGAGDSEQGQPSTINSQVANGSGGISSSGTGHNIGRAEHLSGHSAERIASSGGGGGGGSHGHAHGSSSGQQGRSDASIQAVFDRNKGALYNLYNRALRRNPTLQGKLVLKLTIAPSGRVTRLSIVSSQLGDPRLAQKIKTRVSLFNFGAEDVPTTTVVYPLTFVPS